MNDGLGISKLYKESQVLCRDTMSEKSFRQMEGWIGRACTSGSYIVDPKTEMYRPMTQATFKMRFAEARRGWEMFRYSSDHIPPGYPVRQIKLKALDDGRVVVENLYQDTALARLQGKQTAGPVAERIHQASMQHEFMKMEAQQAQEIGRKVVVPGDVFIEKQKMVEAMIKDPGVVKEVNYIVKNRDKTEKEVNLKWLEAALAGLPIEVRGQAGDGLNIVFLPKSLIPQGEETRP